MTDRKHACLSSCGCCSFQLCFPPARSWQGWGCRQGFGAALAGGSSQSCSENTAGNLWFKEVPDTSDAPCFVFQGWHISRATTPKLMVYPLAKKFCFWWFLHFFYWLLVGEEGVKGRDVCKTLCSCCNRWRSPFDWRRSEMRLILRKLKWCATRKERQVKIQSQTQMPVQDFPWHHFSVRMYRDIVQD